MPSGIPRSHRAHLRRPSQPSPNLISHAFLWLCLQVYRTPLSDEQRQDPDATAVVGALCMLRRGNAVRKYLAMVPLDETWEYKDLKRLMPCPTSHVHSSHHILGGLSPLEPSFNMNPEGIFCVDGSIVRFGAAAGKWTCVVKYTGGNGEIRYGSPLGGPSCPGERHITMQRLLTYAQFQRDYPDVTFHLPFVEYM